MPKHIGDPFAKRPFALAVLWQLDGTIYRTWALARLHDRLAKSMCASQGPVWFWLYEMDMGVCRVSCFRTPEQSMACKLWAVMFWHEKTAGWPTLMVPIARVTYQVALYCRLSNVAASCTARTVVVALSAPPTAASFAAYTTRLMCYTASVLSLLFSLFVAMETAGITIIVENLLEIVDWAASYIRPVATYMSNTVSVVTQTVNNTITHCMPCAAHAMYQSNKHAHNFLPELR